MKPNEHMKSPEDELIAQIKASLSTHEEDYLDGAWEKFNEKKKTPKGLIVLISRISAVAAAVLIGFSVFLFIKRPALEQPATIAKTKEIGTQQASPVIGKDEVVAKRPIHEELADRNVVASITEKKSNRSQNTFSTPYHVMDSGKSVVEHVITTEHSDPKTATVEAVPEAIAKSQVPVERKKSFEDFLAEESKKNSMAKVVNTSSKKQDKWEVGVVVAPSFGNSKKLNMGYGVSMGYALSDKVSINSGISYSQMGASREIETQNPMVANMPSSSGAALASDTKELRSVDANLRGIDIPLEIKYRLSKKVYANVGVSAFAVLDQRQKNNFLESKLAGEFMDGSSDLLSSKTMLVSRSTSEIVPKEQVREDRYLGFYNLSFGYKQTLSKGTAIAVEPFVKLPMKEFTKENLYLIGTGVKLKFDF